MRFKNGNGVLATQRSIVDDDVGCVERPQLPVAAG